MRVDTELFIDASKLSSACSQAETIVAVQVLKDTRPYVPALTMNFNQRSRVVGKHVVYPGPYAHYLWFGKVMVDGDTGRGPYYIPGVGYRFRKGAHLVPTSRNLKYTKSPHPLAQSHWMDASWKKNHEKWAEVARKAVARYG